MRTKRFITFEGVDGAGKSTQLEWMRQFLMSHGIVVKVTREPGGTPLGEKLRVLLLESTRTVHPETEALLMFAARREHIDKVIRPALARGETILCDRFSDASFAYQGGGSGVSLDKLAELEHWVQDKLQPDLTLYFDLPVEVARERLARTGSLDRFERESEAFFNRVREVYLDRANSNPQRMIVIDAAQTPNMINKILEDITLQHCL